MRQPVAGVDKHSISPVVSDAAIVYQYGRARIGYVERIVGGADHFKVLHDWWHPLHVEGAAGVVVAPYSCIVYVDVA